jgi:hypothetical protein
MTGRAGRDLDWWVDKGRLLEGRGKFLMTGKTSLVHWTGKEVLFRRTMRIVACGADAGGNGAMNILAIEGELIVTT